MPRLAKAPSVSLISNARAAPIPCADTPTAKPRARGSCTPRRSSSGVKIIAPNIPAPSTSAAASDGLPPNWRASSIATGVVVARGAIETSTSRGAVNSHMIPTALPIAVADPARSASVIGSASCRISASRAWIGTARPTTAGPSKNPSTAVAPAYVAYPMPVAWTIAITTGVVVSTGWLSGCLPLRRDSASARPNTASVIVSHSNWLVRRSPRPITQAPIAARTLPAPSA